MRFREQQTPFFLWWFSKLQLLYVQKGEYTEAIACGRLISCGSGVMERTHNTELQKSNKEL